MFTAEIDLVVTAAPFFDPAENPTDDSTFAATATASDLASAYAAYVSALWRGVQDAATFGHWLASYRHDQMPNRPLGTPAAVSPHAASGRGITWYDDPDAGVVLGYIGGSAAGYVVPVSEVPTVPSSQPWVVIVHAD